MNAQIRTALGRLGFSNDCADFIVTNQGMDTLDEFRIMDETEIESLCRVCRKPGGTTQVNDVRVNHPGHNVPMKAENNLKLMAFYLKFQHNTSTTVTPADITVENVRGLHALKQWQEDHKDLPAPEIPNKDWPRNFEAIEEWMRGCLGVTGIPLAYVIRAELDPMAPPCGTWPSNQDKLIGRAPIRTVAADGTITWDPTFITDRTRVWELLSTVTRDLDYCWTYVRPAQRTRDGRMAYLALKTHYLGQNYVDQMASAAETKLANTFYNGETRNFPFEKYVRVHVEQHTILQGLVEHGYTGIDPRSKVRYLNNGVKTKMLDTVKTAIMSNPALRSDFDACVNLYTEFIQQAKDNNAKTIGIAQVSTSGEGDNNNNNLKPDMSVEDRYYTSTEYKALSRAKKLGLKAKRKSRGHNASESRGKGKNGRKSAGKGQSVTLSKRSISALAQELNKLDGDTTADTDSDSDEEIEMKAPAKKPRSESQREHKALQRKNIGKKK
jgi:hypothetical protein